MICPTCNGKGQELIKDIYEHDEYYPCWYCEGKGIIHCCEGDQSQPQDQQLDHEYPCQDVVSKEKQY